MMSIDRLLFVIPYFLASVFSTAGVHAASAQAPRIAGTPPMGWNSWNHFRSSIDDKMIRAEADAMVSSGLRDAGYVYINIDDTWEGERDAQGYMHPHRKFSDMKALADYVHSKGLKPGVYSSPGAKTCAGYEGNLGHEKQDAKFARAIAIFALSPQTRLIEVQRRLGTCSTVRGWVRNPGT
jgi:alpha-galactosidase